MCEANAFLKNGDREELLLESVDKITPEADTLVLEDIFGQRKIVRGKIVGMALVEHKIVIEELQP
ncbi:CooT family nickel-binding protein [Desulfosporosinus sp. PR]|uniref:CooT family nickel-binding protein n=1 Tax=Candidatus Desulfosporosinus nitrosoreducens TaxID=3401928 RepID=UPI0027EEABA4|nr:CooT family nickel-binding protein [Desulfosporosinus sp. PR]MDQ7093759.1 CooT family nickel-binding protein [Desulfosporosinus sp. PR]